MERGDRHGANRYGTISDRLTCILGYARLLEFADDSLPQAQRKVYAREILDHTRALAQLIGFLAGSRSMEDAHAPVQRDALPLGRSSNLGDEVVVEVLAVVSVTADDAIAKGKIVRVEGQYLVLLDDQLVGGSVDNSVTAADRLIDELAERLPPSPATCGATVNCSGAGLPIAFGNEASESPDAEPRLGDAKQVLTGSKVDDLEKALLAIAQIISRDCG